MLLNIGRNVKKYKRELLKIHCAQIVILKTE
jgi:hypothetical protein